MAVQGQQETELDYINAMINWAADDARQVYLRVTATLAIATLFVTQIPIDKLRALHRAATLEFFFGLGCLLAAAGLYFIYVGKTHHARRTVARYFVNRRVELEPDRVLTNVWLTWRPTLWGGNLLFAVGSVLLGLVLYALIAEGPKHHQHARTTRAEPASIIRPAPDPFSGRPTAHRVRFESGHEVFAMCAIDALGTAPMFDQPIEITSRDPLSGEAIHLELEPDGKCAAQPPEAVPIT